MDHRENLKVSDSWTCPVCKRGFKENDLVLTATDTATGELVAVIHYNCVVDRAYSVSKGVWTEGQIGVS